jgi:hypothetical protein
MRRVGPKILGRGCKFEQACHAAHKEARALNARAE